MYFKYFDNKDKISKAGFRKCSVKELEAYGVSYEKLKSIKPKINYFSWAEENYFFDGSVWTGDCFDYPYEHDGFYLCRMPIPQFKDMWNLYLFGDIDDSNGAQYFMLDKHENELITAIESLKSMEIDRKLRKKLLSLKKSKGVETAYRRDKIISAIESVLEI